MRHPFQLSDYIKLISKIFSTIKNTLNGITKQVTEKHD
jgi:hypothetical protein